MRSAGETDEADVLYSRAMVKAGAAKGKSPRPTEGSLIDDDIDEGPTVNDQIKAVEDLLRKLNLVKKERTQILKDLKEKVCLIRI
jgi:programmed cell death 6-interacting protein